jgi:hypothetical protein
MCVNRCLAIALDCMKIRETLVGWALPTTTSPTNSVSVEILFGSGFLNGDDIIASNYRS